MKPHRLKISERDFAELQTLVFADLPREAGAFALAGIAETPTSIDIIVRRPVAIPRHWFSVQHEIRLEVSSQAINGLISLCEANGLGAILCHSHPSDFSYSPSDDYGEQRVLAVLRQFIPPSAPTASLLFYPGGVRGRVWLLEQSKPTPLAEIVVMGSRVQRILPDHRQGSVVGQSDSLVYDRQIRAFGKEGQAMLAQAKVGIVGIGGTGSPTAEQLVRLGVKDLILVDPDVTESSNITRVYGTFHTTLGERLSRTLKIPRFKADVVAAHLRRINPSATIKVLHQSVVQSKAAMALRDRDILFLCTDDHWGRSIVNRFAHQYFIPTINVGVAIAARDGVISAAVGVVDILSPDLPCLWCKNSLQPERIAAESMPRGARQRLGDEGYIEGLDIPNPSVVSTTTALSGMAVTMFLQLITGFMSERGNVSRLNYDILDATVRRGTTEVARNCQCRQVRGFGDLKSLNTLTDIGFLSR